VVHGARAAAICQWDSRDCWPPEHPDSVSAVGRRALVERGPAAQMDHLREDAAEPRADKGQTMATALMDWEPAAHE